MLELFRWLRTIIFYYSLLLFYYFLLLNIKKSLSKMIIKRCIAGTVYQHASNVDVKWHHVFCRSHPYQNHKFVISHSCKSRTDHEILHIDLLSPLWIEYRFLWHFSLPNPFPLNGVIIRDKLCTLHIDLIDKVLTLHTVHFSYHLHKKRTTYKRHDH